MPCNIAYCVFCNASNFCQSCLNNYQNVNGICSGNNSFSIPKCSPPCFTCDFYGKCLTCLPPFLALATPNCNIPTVPFCYSYNSTSNLTCTACNIRYYLAFTGTGRQCLYRGNYYCSSYNDTNQNYCIQCNQFYVPVNGTCLPCSAGPACSVCSTNLTSCISCLNGFFLDNGQCVPCQPYCFACTNSYSCTFYNISQGPIISAYDSNNQFAIALCPSSCLTCKTNTLFCLTCQLGFYYAGRGVCAPCNPNSNCLTCSMINPSLCLTCNYPYFLSINNSTCTTCQSPCLTCLSTVNLSYCTSCSLGYTLVNNSCIFTNCSNLYCMACSSTNVCLQCLPGYSLSASGSGNCIPVGAGCNLTSPTNPSLCQSCYPGTTLNYDSNFCITCPDNCINCVSKNTCISCMSGFYLTGNISMVCAPNCILPCMTCLYNSPSTCISCMAGYTMLSNGTCIPNSCSVSGSCAFCPLGYGLLSPQVCSPCNIAFCASCNLFTPNCTGCLPGYYLILNQCLACSSNCASCINGNSCQYCSVGYTKLTVALYNGIQNLGLCVACQSPCATCWGHPAACLSCISGYTRFGSNCLTNSFYSATLTLNTTLPTFVSNY